MLKFLYSWLIRFIKYIKVTLYKNLSYFLIIHKVTLLILIKWLLSHKYIATEVNAYLWRNKVNIKEKHFNVLKMLIHGEVLAFLERIKDLLKAKNDSAIHFWRTLTLAWRRETRVSQISNQRGTISFLIQLPVGVKDHPRLGLQETSHKCFNCVSQRNLFWDCISSYKQDFIVSSTDKKADLTLLALYI